MKKIALLSVLILAGCASAGPAQDYRAELIKYEGYSEVSYHDRGGYSTGIGHHIYGKVKRGYSPEEVESFYQQDLKRNLRVCREGIERFDDLPFDVQQVCVGVAWGVGEHGFMKFAKFRAALSIRDYGKAVYELENSQWFSQVSRSRSNNYITTLQTQ